MKKLLFIMVMFTYSAMAVDSCASAIKEFDLIMKINEFYGTVYGMAKKKYALKGVNSAKLVLSECEKTSDIKKEMRLEEAQYYIDYYDEGLALADSGRTFPYAFVKDTCWNTEKVTELIDEYIYPSYVHADKERVMLFRTTINLVRQASVRAASICEDTRNHDLMVKAQQIYNKYDQ